MDVIVQRCRLELEFANQTLAKELSSDVRHMHYLISRPLRSDGSASDAMKSSKEDRITDYIPCHTYKELQDLNMRLDLDTLFFIHAVRDMFNV